MREAKFHIGLILGITTFYGCQKAINLQATTTNANILVVEGLINVADSTKINLSRTVIIGNKTTANPEQGATVTMETAQATVATLKEISKGTYASPILNLDKTQKYRLRIISRISGTYLSDLVEVKVTPPIDSVGYTIKSDGIQLYANTHDDSNNSRYYLYNFSETWKFNAKYSSSLIAQGTQLRDRTSAENITTCFTSTPSNKIVLSSTATLTQDVSYQAPVAFIESTSEKISIRYTTLLTQTALTKQAYLFWDNLRKSTEALGSIFDAQPSQLIGNIHNVANANEPVIGYISAGTTQSKRIFIDKRELPPTFKTEYPYGCVMNVGDYNALFFSGSNNPFVPLYYKYDDPAGIAYSNKQCSDCTVRGTIKQPAFWK